MNIKSKILKIRNLPTDGKKIDQINAKPYLFIIVFLIVGICLMCTRLYLVGFVVTFLFLYYLLFVKDVVLIEFFDRYAVFYLNNGKDECFLLFWEDVLHWSISGNRNDLDLLSIVLRNNETVALKCLSRKKVEKYFQLCTAHDEEKEISKQHAL